MRLYIAEKASVGRALAAVLPGESVKEDDHIRCGTEVVAWASGHLLELYAPEEYDERYAKWNLDDLPIIPEKWKLKEIGRTKKLLNGIRKLLKDADEVVNAGDADREGQLLIDEILEYCGWKGPTKRLRINDVNPDAIRKALGEMRNNADYLGEYRAGQARSYADWLAGMNLSRYCTLSADRAGYTGVFSVGRVQTPTLGLVVRRDQAIDSFVPVPYFVLRATLKLSDGRKITGRWQPNDRTTLDEEDRLIDYAAAKALEEKLIGAHGGITNIDRKMHKKNPPLPHNLAQLQIEASKKYDITDTLDHAQKLYEQGCITYPRSACRYIPEGHHADAPKIFETIRESCPAFADVCRSADTSRKSPAWDDGKITEHHAILPTAKRPEKLSESEQKIYELICLRYVLQFLPDYEYMETTVEFKSVGETFRATGKEVLVPGWFVWDKEPEDEDGKNEKIPPVLLSEGGTVSPCIEEKKTTPPKHFSYDSLIAAMNGIHLYVEDKEIRKELKELDGIGTSATQENIVKLLFERGFIEKKKKQLHSTALGRALICLLSASEKAAPMVKPDLTALWERKMTQIEEGKLTLESFLNEVGEMVSAVVGKPLAVPDELEGMERSPECLQDGCTGRLKRKESKYGAFCVCSVCHSTFGCNADGSPVKKKTPDEAVVEAFCPLGCGDKARRYEGKYGKYWRCSCSEQTFRDVDGKPQLRTAGDRPQIPCPTKSCKGKAERFERKDGSGAFWKCQICKKFFDDADGKPRQRQQTKSSALKGKAKNNTEENEMKDAEAKKQLK